jgi:hypothetical protein
VQTEQVNCVHAHVHSTTTFPIFSLPAIPQPLPCFVLRGPRRHRFLQVLRLECFTRSRLAVPSPFLEPGIESLPSNVTIQSFNGALSPQIVNILHPVGQQLLTHDVEQVRPHQIALPLFAQSQGYSRSAPRSRACSSVICDAATIAKWRM